MVKLLAVMPSIPARRARYKKAQFSADADRGSLVARGKSRTVRPLRISVAAGENGPVVTLSGGLTSPWLPN